MTLGWSNLGKKTLRGGKKTHGPSGKNAIGPTKRKFIQRKRRGAKPSPNEKQKMNPPQGAPEVKPRNTRTISRSSSKKLITQKEAEPSLPQKTAVYYRKTGRQETTKGGRAKMLNTAHQWKQKVPTEKRGQATWWNRRGPARPPKKSH